MYIAIGEASSANKIPPLFGNLGKRICATTKTRAFAPNSQM